MSRVVWLTAIQPSPGKHSADRGPGSLQSKHLVDQPSNSLILTPNR